jgi:hypothetical protein
MKLIQSWWDFSQCWDGVGATLFWWTMLMLTAFVLASVMFLLRKTCMRKSWVFILVMALVLGAHFFILLVTWSKVYGTLYITSYHWAPGEQNENAFKMWQAIVCLGTLSSCLLTGALLLVIPDNNSQQVFAGDSLNRGGFSNT